MARTINEQEYTARRTDILNAALRLVYTRGYERMTIQGILAELKISSGAFYHYFPTKPAVLEAIIERMQQDVENALLPNVNDPYLSAIQKLHRFHFTLNEQRLFYKTTVIDLLRVWYTDDNAIVRQKVDAATNARRAPLLTAIVRQGIAEGVFSTPYPDTSGEIIQALLARMGDTHAALLLASIRGDGPAGGDRTAGGERSTGGDNSANGDPSGALIDGIITTHAAYLTAIERVLGAPPGSLPRLDPAPVRAWVSALIAARPIPNPESRITE